MSPIFEPDFTSVEANIPIFEKGRYQVKIIKRTAFMREAKHPDTGDVYISCGVRYGLEMVGQYDDDGELQTDKIAGKTVTPYSCYTRTEGGWKFCKPFIMAACGFRRKEERDANAKLFQKYSWIINGEVGQDADAFEELGNGWDQLVDRLIDVTLSKEVVERDGEVYENQDYGSWAPVAA